MLSFITDELESAGCAEEIKMQISIAVEEIFVNIFSYAYPPKEGNATIRIDIGGDTGCGADRDDGSGRAVRSPAEVGSGYHPFCGGARHRRPWHFYGQADDG